MNVYILFADDKLIDVFASVDDAMDWPFAHDGVKRPHEYDPVYPAWENEWQQAADYLGCAYSLWPRKSSTQYTIHECTVRETSRPTPLS